MSKKGNANDSYNKRRGKSKIEDRRSKHGQDDPPDSKDRKILINAWDKEEFKDNFPSPDVNAKDTGKNPKSRSENEKLRPTGQRRPADNKNQSFQKKPADTHSSKSSKNPPKVHGLKSPNISPEMYGSIPPKNPPEMQSAKSQMNRPETQRSTPQEKTPENEPSESQSKSTEAQSEKSDLSLMVRTPNPAKALERALLSIQKSTNSFAISLFKALGKIKRHSNIIISTGIVRTIMALAYCGAIGQTKREILKFFKLPEDVEIMIPANSALVTRSSHSCMHSASIIAVDEQHQVYEEFLRSAKKYFGTQVVQSNFTGNKKSGINLLNSIIKGRTNGMIEEAIHESYFPTKTSVVLMDASYFQTKWNKKFPSENIMERKFFLNNEQFVTIDMLQIREQFEYLFHPGLNAKVLEMPIESNSFSMFIILPVDVDGIESLEANLNKFDLATEIFAKLIQEEVEVVLPKFSLSQTIDLKKLLLSSGVSEVFLERESDLSNISESSCFVNRVLMKASIDVNEEGVEPATTIDCLERTSKLNQSFVANHPFIFIITKNDTSQGYLITFIGKFGYIVSKKEKARSCCDKCTC